MQSATVAAKATDRPKPGPPPGRRPPGAGAEPGPAGSAAAAAQPDRPVQPAAKHSLADLPELSFVHPIPGFADLRRFMLVRLDPPKPSDDAESVAAEAISAEPGTVVDGPAPEESPLYELRSLEQADVRFMVAVPGAYFSGYDIELDDHECGDLGLTAAEDALVLVMLTVGTDAASTTANLLAPVVINARTRAAAQVILTGSDWPVRAPLG